jgi:hypothetical protein
MKVRKIVFILFVSLILIATLTVFLVFRNTIFFHRLNEELKASPSVESEQEINNIISKLERVPISKLPKEFLESGYFSKLEFQAYFQGRYFYKLSMEQAMEKIVDNWRIIDFISGDQKNQWFYSLDKELYWLMDKKVLIAFLQLKKKMEEKDLDWDAIRLNSANRSPYWNGVVGGAAYSRHLCGDAIDFSVGDVDKNGITNYEDKLKVLELCELIIGDKGGIGLYPKTQAIHIDTRGRRARWNSYTPGK